MTLEMEPPTVAARPPEAARPEPAGFPSGRVGKAGETAGRVGKAGETTGRVGKAGETVGRVEKAGETVGRVQKAVGKNEEPPARPDQVTMPTRRPVVHRTEQEIRADRLAAARRVDAALHIAVVSIAWLVLVPFLYGWGVLGAERSAGAILLAGLLAIVLPFTAAVLATRVALFFTAGCYAVLTLVMVIPAVSIVRAG